ncbi:MAG TPA: RNA-binding protein [Bacteroidales bacterium]|nr:RNA-binding protein [Bacteroidales bacterium]
MTTHFRLDKYLWAIRAYKTRSLSTEACKNGRIKVNGIVAKASRELKIGDQIGFKVDQLNKQIEVTQLIHNRVNPTLALDNYNDITPKEEIERVEMIRQMKDEKRDRGIGRPSKKDRRDIEKLKGI